MKKLLFLFLISVSFIGKAQTFTLTDTTFEVGDSLIMDINYHFNHSRIIEESKPILDSISHLLEAFSSLQIEVSNHTDSRGPELYNLKLSEGRAKWVVEYLMEKGIKKERLSYIGYGESHLINFDKEINLGASEEERESLHAKNRRTVFKIIAL